MEKGEKEMTEAMEFCIPESLDGARLDAAVASLSDLSRAAVVRLIEEGCLTLSGKAPDKKTRVKAGDTVSVIRQEPTEIEARPERIPLDIVYEDDDIIVVNKKSGMVVHPAPGSESGTLVNALLYHCGKTLSGINGALRPGIVHRIDKDTSGLLVVAKNDAAHRALAAMLESHEIVREYHALVSGGFQEDSGKIDLPIGRHPVDRKKMAVLRQGEGHSRHAVTHYEVVERFGAVSYLRLWLETGRTHQIRVHMSYKGHTLLGDTTYGGGNTVFEKRNAALLSGQCLHAKRLTLRHPRTNAEMSFESPLPEDFEALLTILRKQNK